MENDLTKAWLRELGRSPGTIRTYRAALRIYPGQLDRAQVLDWATQQLRDGAEPATVRLRLCVLKLYSAWLAEQGEADQDVLHGLKLPPVPAKPVQPLSDADLAAIVKACAGKDFTAVRDRAAVQVFVECGLRLAECAGLTVPDINLDAGRLVVVGKGGRARIVSFGPQGVAALSRYERARRRNLAVETDAWWLTESGRPLSYSGLDRSMRKVAERAGIPGYHTHLYRHTAATRWLARGGSESGLMTRLGWKSHEMLGRYTAWSRQELAAAEAERLNLGDIT